MEEIEYTGKEYAEFLEKKIPTLTDGVVRVVDHTKKPIDKSQMMYEIYMEGVNMGGEYQGCWVRFKDIERIVDKYIGD